SGSNRFLEPGEPLLGARERLELPLHRLPSLDGGLDTASMLAREPPERVEPPFHLLETPGIRCERGAVACDGMRSVPYLLERRLELLRDLPEPLVEGRRLPEPLGCPRDPIRSAIVRLQLRLAEGCSLPKPFD